MRPRTCSAALVGLLASSLLAAGATVAAEAPAAPVAETAADHPWKAVAASGRVEALPAIDATWDRVRRGDRLRAQSAVRTGDRGRATLVRNRDIVTVSPDSQLHLPAAGPVRQDAGRVVYEVDGTVGRDFRVETPYLVAGVKGTVFMVTVERGFAAVTVDEGVVEVLDRATGNRVDVLQGETALIDVAAEEAMEVVRHDTRRDRSGAEVARDPRTDVVRRARAEAKHLDQALDIRDHQVSAKFADWVGSGALAGHGKNDARPDRPDAARPDLKDLLDRPDAEVDDVAGDLAGGNFADRPMLDLLDELLLDLEIDLLRDRILERKRRDALRDPSDDALDPGLERGDRQGRRTRDGDRDDVLDDLDRGKLDEVRDEAGSRRKD